LGIDAYYHCSNEATGLVSDSLLSAIDREKFFETLQELQRFFTVEVISAVVTANSWRVIVYAPGVTPSLTETAIRYNDFHRNEIRLQPNDPKIRTVQKRLNDISWFFHYLGRGYTHWYNRSRKERRYGPLWRQRFVSTLVESIHGDPGCAVMNAILALEAVSLTEDRCLSSWSICREKDEHPFANNFFRHVASILNSEDSPSSRNQIEAWIGCEVAAIVRAQRQEDAIAIEAAAQAGRSKPNARSLAERHRRPWTHGGIVGSRSFVMSENELFNRELAAFRGNYRLGLFGDLLFLLVRYRKPPG
jgi:hypothetical protein